MINVYRTRKGDSSYIKVERWLKNHNLSYNIITSTGINGDIIKKMLVLSNNGFRDIISSRKKAKKTWSILGLDDKTLECMSIQEFIHFLSKNPCLLKSPIIFDDKSLISGFNADEIRVFIPRKQRISK